MIVPLYIIFLVAFVKAQPCEDSGKIDITAGRKFHDGSIVYNHITFPPNFVFEQNITGEFRIFGCICEVTKCLRKCCELGKVLDTGTKKCIESPKEDKLLVNGLRLHYMKTYQRTVAVDKDFTLFYGWPCRPSTVYIEDSDWFVQEVIIIFYINLNAWNQFPLSFIPNLCLMMIVIMFFDV